MNTMTRDAYQENAKCSEKMERDGGLRTVECLRGRLLAERQASKVAKEAAEQFNKKIAELESHLEEEIKLRKKAEKKLKFLMKKFESLKGSCNFEGSEQSSSSEVSAVSCVSSKCTSRSREDPESNTQIINTEETYDHGGVDSDRPDQINANIPSMEVNSSSKLKDLSSGRVSACSTTSHEDPQADNSSSAVDLNTEKKSNVDENSLALVALEIPSKRRQQKIQDLRQENV